MQNKRTWIAAALLTAHATLAESYTLTDLGPGSANDINASGTVIGNGPTGGFVRDGGGQRLISFWGIPGGLPPGLPLSQ